MKIVAVIVSLLAVTHHALALECAKTDYKNDFISLCATEKDTKILWPDYGDASRYYRCQGIGNPILEECFPNTIFTFYQQMCTKCDKYVPAPPCEELTAAKNCQILQVTTRPPTTTLSSATMVPPRCEFKTYTHTLIPTCLGNDVYRLWPNYEDPSTYYQCKGPYNAVMKYCPRNTYFNYYAQYCTGCGTFVAAPDCDKIISQADKTNECKKKK